MDQRIYDPRINGVYDTRRFSRNSGVASPVPTGGIPAELNPTSVVLLYDKVQTHGLTDGTDGLLIDRFIYTVPLYRRLRIQSAQARQSMIVSLSAPGQFFGEVSILRKGSLDPKETLQGSNNAFENRPKRSKIAQQHGVFIGDTSDPKFDNNVGRIEAYSGDTIFGSTFTSFGNANGSIRFILNVVAIEYDER